MSMVVDDRLCRICACTAFGSAPASTNQVAYERRNTCQFTHPRPSRLAAGLMCLDRTLWSDIGPRLMRDWNTRSPGASERTSLKVLLAPRAPQLIATAMSFRRLM